ncbi:MAG: MarR family transcriptional regulator [Candidatus Aminicenantes bacterium]|nr:MarR family transcriptional regulator [Candidatus Aminicenantes bacterium]NIM78599.1 MarR family transcriptional regulator [Candidatus Aminicenantes bacterium]NIN17844.1 MarR family transcriptional regulator [Candidatus Aminicenantes bacterium]NIN41748.1 MarR family transcriptional regulator [Candidatus Aminicenantes bacterium]NIN84497.1 MarR family transcriptional regulator [Candidatus Aminicenantes bacterium]
MESHKENGETVSLESEIFSCLRKIINAVEIYSAKLKDRTDLNASQLSCLLALANKDPLALSKLSRKVHLSPSMITSVVDQLEKKELVIRNRKSSDRRVVLIELTEKGKEVVKTAPPSFQEQLMNSLSYIKEEEKKSLYEHLNILLSIIVSEVLIDSSLLGGENKLVEVEPSVLGKEEFS